MHKSAHVALLRESESMMSSRVLDCTYSTHWLKCLNKVASNKVACFKTAVAPFGSASGSPWCVSKWTLQSPALKKEKSPRQVGSKPGVGTYISRKLQVGFPRH